MNEEIYHQIYASWSDEMIASRTAYYQACLKERLPSDKSARILDIGCGIGISLRALNDLGYTHTCGIEINRLHAEFCKARGQDVLHCEDTVDYLNQHANTFDVIICFDVLEHIAVPEQSKFLQAITNTLKPNGTLVGTVPNAVSLISLYWHWNEPTHQWRMFTPYTLELFFQEAGLNNAIFSETPEKNIPKFKYNPFDWKARHWWLRRFFRKWTRLIYKVETANSPNATQLPLSLDILFQAHKNSARAVSSQ